jgi:hypothetical protein
LWQAPASVWLSRCHLRSSYFQSPRKQTPEIGGYDEAISHNAQQMLAEGKQTFRFDTFGSEAFWGDTLKLHEAVAQQTLKKLQQAKPNKTKETKS